MPVPRRPVPAGEVWLEERRGGRSPFFSACVRAPSVYAVRPTRR